MAASAASGLVLETGGLTSVAVSQASSPVRDGASSIRVSREPEAGEAFTQRVQQALQSLDLTPSSTSSTQQLSAVLYDLFQAMDRESAPASSATPGNANAPVLAISGSPWKPVDMVSGLHTLIDQLQSQSTTASTASASTVSSTGNRNELAQLQADFAALVHGTPDTSSHMTTTLIQFLKALQQNLPAWPPSLAAVGGNVNATA